MQALEPRAGDELERLIERYGRVRLDPSPAQSRRARAAVMEEAWRRRLAPELAEAAARDSACATPAAARAVRLVGRAAPGRGAGRGRAGRADGRVLGLRRIPGRRAAVRHAAVARGAHAAQRPLHPPRCRACARPDAGSPRSPKRASRGDDGAVNAAVRAYASTLADLDAETGTSAGRARDAVLPPPGGAARPPPARADAGAGRDRTRHLQQHGRDRPPRPGVARARHAGRRRRRQPQRGRRQPERRRRATRTPAAGMAAAVRNGGGDPNADGGNPNAGGGNGGGAGNPNAGGGNGGGGNPNAGGGERPAAGTAASPIGRPSPNPRRRPSTSRRPATDPGRARRAEPRPRGNRGHAGPLAATLVR